MTVPNTFVNSTVAHADEVNENFTYFENADIILKKSSILGNGEDGARTISVSADEVALLDVSYTNLTINASQTWGLITGSIIKVTGTLTINGSIRTLAGIAGGAGGVAVGTSSGKSGGGGTGGGAGGKITIIANSVVCGAGSTINGNGYAGSNATAIVDGNNSTVNGNNGTIGANVNLFNLSFALTAGNAGGGGPTIGSVGGAGGAETTPITGPLPYLLQNGTLFNSTGYPSSGGGGGSGGIQSNSSNAIGGGGGGSGGAFISKGGAGGVGENDTSYAGEAGGAGGGGGSGGIIVLKYFSITNPANLTISANGGAGGNGTIGVAAETCCGGGGGGGSGGYILIIGPTASTINATVTAGAKGVRGDLTVSTIYDGADGGVGLVTALNILG